MILDKNDWSRWNRLLDFLRMGMSWAQKEGIYYGHGTDNAWDEIRLLLLDSLDLPLDCDSILYQAQLTETEKQHLFEQLRKRIEDRVPSAYLTQKAHFCELDFYVDARVLIPRSPIAELIKRQFSPWIDNERVNRILEIGTGSGCIAIACHYAFPQALIDATDISEKALEVAAINCKRHGLKECIRLIQSDGWQHVSEKYDIIVTNPPYVGSEEMRTLPKEYQYEPNIALEAPSQGLALVEIILTQAHGYLNDGGILIMEVGNSEALLIERYPTVPFVWLDFECDAIGVLLITKEQLLTHFS